MCGRIRSCNRANAGPSPERPNTVGQKRYNEHGKDHIGESPVPASDECNETEALREEHGGEQHGSGYQQSHRALQFTAIATPPGGSNAFVDRVHETRSTLEKCRKDHQLKDE